MSNANERTSYIHTMQDLIRGQESLLASTISSSSTSVSHCRKTARGQEPTTTHKIVVHAEETNHENSISNNLIIVVAIDTIDRPGVLLDISKVLVRLGLDCQKTEAAVVRKRSLSLWRCKVLENGTLDINDIWKVLNETMSCREGMMMMEEEEQSYASGKSSRRILSGSSFEEDTDTRYEQEGDTTSITARIPLIRYSRYRSEFREISTLGKGGFGAVFKCTKVLDGRDYAVKKVLIKSRLDSHGQLPMEYSKKLDKVLREVKILALLVDHVNIVRYYTAWLELEEEEGHGARGNSFTFDGDCSSSNELVEFTKDQFVSSTGSNSNFQETDVVKYQSHILYIQMQLCQKTLLDYFQSRRQNENIDIPLSLGMFCHIARGVQNVHEKGLIHRDLKPSNCFIDASNVVKVGDFGLSRETGVHQSDADVIEVEITTTTDGDDIGNGEENTAGVGTSSYASPEQISGSDYDSSSDVYSLGIILFELCYPMHTGMERCAVFDGIRQKVPVFPDDWYSSIASKFPTLHRLLVNMLSHHPKQRPTASEVVSCMEALLSEYTVQSLGGSFHSEGARILRVEAEDNYEMTLEKTIRIIQDASPDIHIEEYGLRSKGTRRIMEFAMTLNDDKLDLDDANNLNKALEDVRRQLESRDEIKVARLLND